MPWVIVPLKFFLLHLITYRYWGAKVHLVAESFEGEDRTIKAHFCPRKGCGAKCHVLSKYTQCLSFPKYNFYKIMVIQVIQHRAQLLCSIQQGILGCVKKASSIMELRYKREKQRRLLLKTIWEVIWQLIMHQQDLKVKC